MTRVPDSILTWTRRGTRVVELDETLAIMADGTIWLWITAAADEHGADTAGTFRGAAAGAQLEEARRLAAALRGGSSGASADHPFTVALEGDGVGRTLVPGSAGDDEAAALALLETLTNSALRHPMSAAKASVTFTTGPASGGEGGLVALMVSSIGTEPVQLRLDPEAWTVLIETPSAESRWEPLPRPVIGLVDIRGNLLDGLLAPADIAPGVTGALTVPVGFGPGDASSIRVRLGGTLALRGPGMDMDIPTERFVVVTEPAAIE